MHLGGWRDRYLRHGPGVDLNQPFGLRRDKLRVVEVLYALAAVAGALLALTITANIVRTLVIARARRTVLFDAVDQGVDFVFRMASWPLRTYERKDTLLAAQGAAVVLVQLMTWLLGYEIAYALLLVPTVHGFPTALREAGSSMFTLGFVYTHGNEPAVIDIVAAATGMIVVALQIAYLPTLYGAFNRRETEVTLLGARAGHPPWGPSSYCVPGTAWPYAATTCRRFTTGGNVGRPMWPRATPTIPYWSVFGLRTPWTHGSSGFFQ